MAFRIHGNAYRFADRVSWDLKREMFFGYLQLRSLCLQVELLLSVGLRLRSVGTKALATDTQRRVNDQNAEYQGKHNNVAIHTENLLCEKCAIVSSPVRSGEALRPVLRSKHKEDRPVPAGRHESVGAALSVMILGAILHHDRSGRYAPGVRCRR